MRRIFGLGVLAVVGLMVASCGVPREAGRIAATEYSGISLVPADANDAAVRAALLGQGDAWSALASRVVDREFGGIMGVDDTFIRLVIQTAVLARRQRALIDAGQDDTAANRLVLEKLRKLWEEANAYLNR